MDSVADWLKTSISMEIDEIPPGEVIKTLLSVFSARKTGQAEAGMRALAAIQTRLVKNLVGEILAPNYTSDKQL